QRDVGGATEVTAAAYTNSSDGATATALYTLDSGTDKLFIQNPPNAGTQTLGKPVTLAGAPLDFTAVNGFDIPSGVTVAASNDVAAGQGLAALTVGGVTGLYRIDLSSGAATFAGAVGTGVTGLAGLAAGDAPAGTVAFGTP